MSVLNNKYYVFLISPGRTGTRFLGQKLGNIIKNAYSVHEPDVLTPKKGYKFLEKLNTFGVYHLVLGKFLGKTGIRNLSQRYVAGKFSKKELERAIVKHRKKYYDQIKEDLIIESYSGWYGCIPAIQNLYKNYKIVIISREPKDWVISNMNWGTLFGKRDWVSKLGLGRLNPKMINDKEYINEWKNYSRFGKICWTYKTQYEIMLQNSKGDPNTKIIKFENLFDSDSKYETLNELMSFITSFPDIQFDYSIPSGILDKKVHKNVSYEFPEYENWDEQYKQTFDKICSQISVKLNYEKV